MQANQAENRRTLRVHDASRDEDSVTLGRFNAVKLYLIVIRRRDKCDSKALVPFSIRFCSTDAYHPVRVNAGEDNFAGSRRRDLLCGSRKIPSWTKAETRVDAPFRCEPQDALRRAR